MIDILEALFGIEINNAIEEVVGSEGHPGSEPLDHNDFRYTKIDRLRSGNNA